MRSTGAVAALSAAFAALLYSGVAGVRGTVAIDNAGEAVAALAAAAGCARAARRQPPELRRFWSLLAASALSWAAGQAIWSIYEVGLGQDPFPSAADAGFLGSVPLAVAAMLAYPAAPRPATGRARAVLDGLIVAGSLLFVSATLLGSFFAEFSGSPADVLGLAYPLSDVVVITVGILVAVRARPPNRGPLILVLAGLTVIAVADTAFAYLAQSGTYAGQTSSFGLGNTPGAGWFAGYLLIAVAAWTPTPGPGRRPGPARAGRATLLLPYVPVALAAVVATAKVASEPQFHPVGWWGGSAIVTLLLARQFLTLVENLALTQDLEARVEARTADLERGEARFRSLVQHSSDMVAVLDAGGVVTYVSGGARRLLGQAPDELQGMPVEYLAHPDDLPGLGAALARAATAGAAEVTALGWRLHRRDGAWVDVETTVTSQLDNPAVGGFVLNSRDVSERKALEDQLRARALHDPLTGLPNRTLFHDRLEHALAAQNRRPGAPAVLFVDLDDFKTVNDSAGHTAGDRLIGEVARRLAGAVRAGDTVARLGGDEFAVLLPDLASTAEAGRVAGRVAGVLGHPVTVDATSFSLTASVGVALAEAVSTAEDLLRQADVAMYAAKAGGKNGVRVFDGSMLAAVLDRAALEGDLAGALDRGEISVHYQPIVALAGEAVTGFEALARWTHPTRGAVPPGLFIPAAERTGAIGRLGTFVLETALRQGQEWRRLHPGLELSVNLSARQLDQPDLVAAVAGALSRSRFPAGNLILEITESVLMADGDATLAVLDGITGLGVRLAIDDFGTGYSSLAYLARLPVHELKLDRSYVSRLGEDHRSAAVVEAVLKLAHDLGLIVVAEGVEDTATARLLLAGGCQRGQGYHWSRPLPAGEAAALVGRAPAAPGPSPARPARPAVAGSRAR